MNHSEYNIEMERPHDGRDMKAKHFRNYDDKYRVVLKFDRKIEAQRFIEEWNEVHK